LLQTPEIKHSQIKNIIRDVKAGKKMSLSDSTEIGIEDILRYALTQFDGDLDYRRLWENFRSQGVGRDWLKGELRKLDGKEIFISGTAYKIVLPKDHSTARKLIKA
jgi:hypothetical protein